VGDAVEHEHIRQCRLNTRYHITRPTASESDGESKYVFNDKDVKFVPAVDEDNRSTENPYSTNFAVSYMSRTGVITEIYRGDVYYGPVAKVVQEKFLRR
jgi:hypothetical protein